MFTFDSCPSIFAPGISTDLADRTYCPACDRYVPTRDGTSDWRDHILSAEHRRILSVFQARADRAR